MIRVILEILLRVSYVRQHEVARDAISQVNQALGLLDQHARLGLDIAPMGISRSAIEGLLTEMADLLQLSQLGKNNAKIAASITCQKRAI